MDRYRGTGTLLLMAMSAPMFSQVRTPAPLLVDGHVHITDRVYWEDIDPWKRQPTGDWDYARAREGGVNVVIENIAPYCGSRKLDLSAPPRDDRSSASAHAD